MHRKEQHAHDVESFIDFWVDIPESAGDMTLIFLHFALLTDIVFVLFLPHSLEPLDPFESCRTQWGPCIVLIPSPMIIQLLAHSVLFLASLFYF